MARFLADLQPRRPTRASLLRALAPAGAGVYVAVLAWFDLLAAFTALALEAGLLFLLVLAPPPSDPFWRRLLGGWAVPALFGIVAIAALLVRQREVAFASVCLLLAHAAARHAPGGRTLLASVRLLLQILLLGAVYVGVPALLALLMDASATYDALSIGATGALYFGLVALAELFHVMRPPSSAAPDPPAASPEPAPTSSR